MKKQAFAVSTLSCLFAMPAFSQNSDGSDWTGYYLGVNGGERRSNRIESDASTRLSLISGFALLDSSESGDTAISGLQFGYDRQFGSWVLGGHSGQWLLGAEGDFDAGKQSRGTTHDGLGDLPSCLFSLPCPVVRIGESVAALSDMSVRLRAGLIWRQFLLYATGGLVVGHVRVGVRDTYLDTTHSGLHCALADTDCSIVGIDNKILMGWTVGLGTELALARSVSVALEYRHSDFSNRTFRFTPTFSGNGAQFLQTPNPRNVAPTDDRATLRLNYRFNGV